MRVEEGTPWPRSIRVPVVPVAKGRARFMRNGHIYTPTRTTDAEGEIQRAWVERHGDLPAIGPLSLFIVAWLPMPKSVPKRRREQAEPVVRPDVDNFAKTVLDALQGVAFGDDSQVVELFVRKHYAREGSQPGWEIELSEVVT